MLVLCALALVASPFLDVRGGERVGVRWVPGLVLPPTCLSREMFGVSCPGCGLTRSFVHLAHGDWSASVQSHRLGWLLMAAALFQIPYRAHLLWGSGRFRLGATLSKISALVLISLLITNWLLTLIGL
ncbi:MAG: DUF2752 domain-containing protein [Planctomycetes bacterium]|nr:DUF2752 domain-containing protein [Planctomycetota bacterium]